MSKIKILVVEDETIVAKDIQHMLEVLGYSVPAIVSTGEDSIIKASETSLDLVLMDIRLKGEMDGIEAAGQMRDRFRIPVVFLTAYADDTTLEKAKAVEPYGYILKPLEREDLRINIEIAIYKHKIEKKLRESEERFRALTENSTDITIILNKDWIFEYVSPSVKKVFGYSLEEVVGRHLKEFVHPDDMAVVGKKLEETMQKSGETLVLPDVQIRHSNNNWLRLECMFTAMLDVPGVNGVVINGRDVTERRRAEEQIRKLYLAVEHSPCTVVITNTRGCIEYVNPKFTQLTGYSSEEAIGENPRMLKSGKTPPEVYERLWKTILSGNDWRGEFCNKKKNGELYWESVSISPIKDAGEIITHFVAVKEDVTERKLFEEKLRQSEKLKAMSVITSGVAHEFNNILAIIQGNAQLLELGFQDEKELKDGLKIICKATRDGSDIARRMREFTRAEEKATSNSGVEVLDITALVLETIGPEKTKCEYMGNTKGISYHFNTEGLKRVSPIRGNPLELMEVFVNIINNALEAMPEGGNLSFSSCEKDGNIHVTVSDTGKGMSEDVLKKIFDPFFTTRLPEGSGLGMSVAYGIIKRIGGRINVESELGKGSDITVVLPVASSGSQQNN